MSLFTEYEFSKRGFKMHTLKVMDEIPIVANAYYLMDL